MPGSVRPIADERDGLLTYLAQQRACLRSTVHGLTDEQARLQPIPTTTLSLGGLIKHAALVERHWMQDIVLQRPQPANDTAQDDYAAGFRLESDETLASALNFYDEVAKETEEIIAGIPDLGQPVPIPQDVPWFPKDVKFWSVRWVLFHMIEEVARHGGHADIIRESLDGRTFYELLAASEA